jgi:hypothetical protein
MDLVGNARHKRRVVVSVSRETVILFADIFLIDSHHGPRTLQAQTPSPPHGWVVS